MKKTATTLRAGFARVEITPGPDTSLIGYEFRQSQLPPGNTGVNDPLLASVVAFDDGSRQPALLASLDLCILLPDLARELRRRMAKAAGTTADRVLLACTHTHSGPFPQRAQPDNYLRDLRVKLAEAAARAAALTYPVTITAQQAPLGIGYNRRVRTATGLQYCWNPHEFPDLAPKPASDPACTVIVLQQVNGSRRFLLWSVGVHPVAIGKTSRVVSADWPGLACREIERHAPDTRALFFLGAAGEIHPWIATQEDPSRLTPLAQTAAGFVRTLAEASRGASACLQTTSATVRIGKVTLDLAAWRLGPAWLLAAPVELFNSLGEELRRQLPGPVLLATNTNGWTGYWPDRTAFAEGGYEVDGARQMGRRSGDGEWLVTALRSLASRLRD